MGAGSWKLLTYFHPVSLRKTEYFNIFLLLGSFLLIFPLTLIGIQPSGLLQLKVGKAVLQLVSFKGYSLLYFLISLAISIIICYYSVKWLIAHLEHFNFKIETLKDYRIILIILLLFDYLFLELIQPLRGFDALYYYLPEAEIFSQTGRITEINYLSFLPVVKSPLNVLLFVYTKYITGEFAIHLIPFLFLVGIVLLTYDFALELFENQSIALMASIFVLTLPLTYWLMNWWAFYQDLYLCYFFSIACYFCLKWYKNSTNHIFGGLLTIAIITAILTKITAWTLPIILLVWLPNGIKDKRLRIIAITLLGIFLCIQTATRIFIGNTLPIIVVLLLSAFFIIKENLDFKSEKNLIRIVPIGLGILLGSYWLINRIELSNSVWNGIVNLYFNFSENVMWNYPTQHSDPLLHTLETVHSVNFFSATGILVLGSVFVLPWIILKIYALKNYLPISPLLIWILLFFAIWLAYYSTSSIRYLAPILIPMILCVSWGCYNLISKIKTDKTKQFWEILFIFAGTACFYYLIPINSLTVTDQTQNTIGFAFNQAALNYYSNPIILSLAAVILILTFYYGTKLEVQSKIKGVKKVINLKIIRTLMICVIITIPIAVQSYLLIYSKGNISEFNAIMEYEYRPEYQEMVDVIVQQNQPLSGILTVRTPGIQFFTGQPVLDIYYQRYLFKEDLFFTWTNLSKIISVLLNPQTHIIDLSNQTSFGFSIRYILVPSNQNLYFNSYMTQIYNNSILFRSLENQTYFSKLYNNPEFVLYQIKK